MGGNCNICWEKYKVNSLQKKNLKRVSDPYYYCTAFGYPVYSNSTVSTITLSNARCNQFVTDSHYWTSLNGFWMENPEFVLIHKCSFWSRLTQYHNVDLAAFWRCLYAANITSSQMGTQDTIKLNYCHALRNILRCMLFWHNSSGKIHLKKGKLWH